MFVSSSAHLPPSSNTVRLGSSKRTFCSITTAPEPRLLPGEITHVHGYGCRVAVGRVNTVCE